LKNECQHFVQCIKNRETPRSDGVSGLSVVRVMERACESIRSNGAQLPLCPTSENLSPRGAAS
jgi:predicted dehydrogenase